MTRFSTIEKPLRTLNLRPSPSVLPEIPALHSTVDAVAYLAKMHLTVGKGITPLVHGRVWYAHEVPQNPSWPFIVIANAKKEHGAVVVTVEAWGRWTPETTAIAEGIKGSLPSSFELVTTGVQRPGNTSAGTAVAALTFRRVVPNAA
jgi:hypothetical protein